MKLLLEHGSDVNERAGYFEFAIFAALHGKHPEIVSIILGKAHPCDYLHPDSGTPLHLACSTDSGASVRKLLEHGADLTVTNANGETPLSIALKHEFQSHLTYPDSREEKPLDVIFKLSESLKALDGDLVVASRFWMDSDILGTLLNLDKNIVVSEHVICRVLNDSEYITRGTIRLLMQRSRGLGVTEGMIEAARSHRVLEELLECGPLCKITPGILQSLKDVESMKLLLDRDSEVAVTEGVILRALEFDKLSPPVWFRQSESERDVLELLLERKPELSVTHDMLEAVRCDQHMEILLKRLEPGTRIPNDVVMAVFKLKSRRLDMVLRTMRVLLKFDPRIRISPKLALRTVKSLGPVNGVKMLIMLVEHDASLPITPKMFLRVFGFARSARSQGGKLRRTSELASFMYKHRKRVVFTEEVKATIDQAFPDEDGVEIKERFYGLQATEEEQMNAVEESDDSEDESEDSEDEREVIECPPAAYTAIASR